MRSNALPAGVITSDATISACAKGKEWQSALALFEKMHSLGIWADVITYLATISTCAKGTEWHSVRGLFKEMPSLGFQADVITIDWVDAAALLARIWNP